VVAVAVGGRVNVKRSEVQDISVARSVSSRGPIEVVATGASQGTRVNIPAI